MFGWSKKLLKADYLEVIFDRINACLSGKINRLIINIPPRHMKSVITSVALPAFVLAKSAASSPPVQGLTIPQFLLLVSF